MAGITEPSSIPFIRNTIEEYLWESNGVTVSYVPPDGDIRGMVAITGYLDTQALADAIHLLVCPRTTERQ